MSATVGVCTVAAIAIGLVVANKWFHERKKRRTKEENAERARLWADIDKKRIERATWWREETLRRLNQCEDRAKVTAMEQQRLEQACDVVDELADSIGGTLPSARHRSPRIVLHPTIVEINENQRRRNMELLDQFSFLGGSVNPSASDIDKFAGISWQPSEASASTPSPAYTGSGGSFDGGGSSGDYSSSSSSDSSTSSSGD